MLMQTGEKDSLTTNFPQNHRSTQLIFQNIKLAPELKLKVMHSFPSPHLFSTTHFNKKGNNYN